MANSQKQQTITRYFTRSKKKPQNSEPEDLKIIQHLKNQTDPKFFKIIEDYIKGKGVVTTKKIKKGSFVCEYAGQLIKLSEAKKREKDYEKKEIGCYMYFFIHNSIRFCIDATKPTGRIGRLINHSRKAPNLKTKIFVFEGTPHLIFLAARDIDPDEELHYDYGEQDKNTIAAHPWIKNS